MTMIRKVVVHFEPREDGGLSVWADDLPGLHLSHSDPALVIDDVPRALAVLITDMLGERVTVEPLLGIREQAPARIPEPGVSVREYVSRPIAA
jgi:hypothetical protein